MAKGKSDGGGARTTGCGGPSPGTFVCTRPSSLDPRPKVSRPPVVSSRTRPVATRGGRGSSGTPSSPPTLSDRSDPDSSSSASLPPDPLESLESLELLELSDPELELSLEPPPELSPDSSLELSELLELPELLDPLELMCRALRSKFKPTRTHPYA